MSKVKEIVKALIKPAPAVQPEYQDPPVQVQTPPVETRRGDGETGRRGETEKPYDYASDSRFVWPSDKPLPAAYHKPQPMPCPKCRRLRFNTLGQCVVVIAIDKEVAYFRCKACGHQFKMPVA